MDRYLKFWGTRGSCAVSGPEYLRYGGNTCCLEVSYGDTRLIIDAGTGIRPFGRSLKNKLQKIDLFIGHTHWDHMIGFPFFDLIYQTGAQITIWSPAGQGRSCRELFANLLSPEFFPVRLDQAQAKLEFRTISEKVPVQIGPLTLDFHTTHHSGLAFSFKIKTPRQTIGYVTDNEMFRGYHGEISGISAEIAEPYQDLIHFYQGMDLFIHEAQYFPDQYVHKVGWGHSSLRNTVALIQRVNPARWCVTHHDPVHTDSDLDRLQALAKDLLKANRISCEVEWLPDGHTISLL